MASWLLIDGFNFAFRSFYGMPGLSREDGFPTGAIHGWLRSLWYLEDHYPHDHTIVFFDLGGASRQTALREDYKANRTDTPPDLVRQMPYIKSLTRAMGLGGLEENGVEADDLIGAWVRALCSAGHQPVTIASADKDLGQCLTHEAVRQLLPPPTANPRLGWRLLDAAAVEEKFGVPPQLIPDYLALLGDSSDNIPGLRGVGPKTAVSWLRQYGSLEGIFANSGDLKPARFQGIVHAERDNLRRNLEMTTLDPACTTCPTLLENIPSPSPAQIFQLLEELEMKTALRDAQKRYT